MGAEGAIHKSQDVQETSEVWGVVHHLWHCIGSRTETDTQMIPAIPLLGLYMASFSEEGREETQQ